jgi:hypothetical protein
MSAAQMSDKDRPGLKEHQSNVATSRAENNKKLALQILSKRMEPMPENMQLEIIKKLSEIGTQVPAGRTPMDSIQQSFGLPGGGSQPSLGGRPGSNPVKEAGMLLEAINQSVGLPLFLGDRPDFNPVKKIGDLLEALEHIARYFKERHASDQASRNNA